MKFNHICIPIMDAFKGEIHLPHWAARPHLGTTPNAPYLHRLKTVPMRRLSR